MAMSGRASFAAAQDQPDRVQRITDRLHAGELHAYRLKDLHVPASGDYMKCMENEGKDDRVQRIDKVLDRAYPLSYAALIGVVILLFF